MHTNNTVNKNLHMNLDDITVALHVNYKHNEMIVAQDGKMKY